MTDDIKPAQQLPDFYLDNQPGAPFRAELNTIIAALVSSNAGATEPKNPQAGWLWLNTSKKPWVLYRRNADNTAWIKQYDAQNRPTKNDVKLGRVPNFAATSSITDQSASKFATAKAVSTLNNNKLEKTGIAADSARLGKVPAASYALQTGNYSGLRARATTKVDVGLGRVPDYPISNSTTSKNAKAFASSKAVYDLNMAKLGKSEQAANSKLLNGKADSAFANKTHQHNAEELPTGTTSAPGIVKMNDSTGSNSTREAATANAVRKAKSEAIASGVPSGCIMMWAGTIDKVPNGWKLCDGNGKTKNGIAVPDLRNRFIVGAGSGYAPGKTGGATSARTSSSGAHSHSVKVNSAGAHSHSVTVANTTLSESQMPKHQHKAPVASNQPYGIGDDKAKTPATTYYFRRTSLTSSFGGSRPHTHSASTNSTGAHTHSASTHSAGAHTHTVSTLPPYYALAYIIKL
ncbi:tail fiber protein [Endozoicomonas gorgoniicola]|uniref:Tail fiber protein n=1 Tax=Endozoicomonas gorgoniicola TaxID=1234144 RepID=A0ABT3MRX7_9GAMM|nr:tail fiber protein [Endozoicomonas gorgoniicola]MCW7552122.1 tail fiber protein [Endozoicomonas gorgoniicola]